ncbi:MAG: hypothetical protein VX178_03680, partial [Pseudomonadota bacterium]|nr:hypothetical protein [Pseudomonadota bacterium]
RVSISDRRSKGKSAFGALGPGVVLHRDNLTEPQFTQGAIYEHGGGGPRPPPSGSIPTAAGLSAFSNGVPIPKLSASYILTTENNVETT